MTGGPNVKRGERPIWMSEDFYEMRRNVSWLSSFEKVMFCVEGVRSCDYFLAVLTNRPGNEFEFSGVGQVPTSFFELELTAAALFGKPCFIFLHSDFEPSDKLAGFLKMVEPAFPNISFEKLSENEILRRIERLIKQVEHLVFRHLVRVPRKQLFIDTLFRLRHKPYRVREEPPPIRFLDGQFDPNIGRATSEVVPKLLSAAHAEQNYQSRLIILWIAIHSLMGVPYTDPSCREFLPLWEDAMSSWASAAAWYGLHGHAAMAGLAALSSLGAARLSLGALGDPLHGIPHGPIASAYYSIAKHAAPAMLYSLALEHIEAALAHAPPDAANLLAIRGSIHLRLHDRDAAIADYREVARARADLEGGSYGEALVELGFAQVFAGQGREGLGAIELGIDFIRTDPRQGFEVRALRKYSIALLRGGNILKALDYAILAYDKAIQYGAFDQISRLERFAKRLEWLRRRPASQETKR